MYVMTSGPDQSNELSMLYDINDDGSISPDSQVLEGLTVQLEYFDCLVHVLV